ncbi:MAG TPA: diguanylate cyclase [Casimicrobiaceae bacterium]|nr:diguanylate cyclase [Casimicrobiaceae bacterium]
MDAGETPRPAARAPHVRDIARDTLRLLAERRLPPTPEHYERCWREVEATPDGARAPSAPVASRGWGELLAQALRVGVVPQLAHLPDLQEEARTLAAEAAALGVAGADHDEVQRYGLRLRQFWEALADSNLDADQIRGGLMRILKILVGNIAELLSDDSWLRGQLQVVDAMTERPLDLETVHEIEKRLRELAFQQGVLKQSLDQAKDAMRTMVATFIERLAVLAEGTGGYHERLEQHAKRIERAGTLAELSTLVVEIMEDTRGVQGEIGRSRDELVAAQRTVEEQEARAKQLERELTSLSSRLNEDFLTQQLNRRGLARAYVGEASRADRSDRPLCVAMLDIDHFKRLNDRLGHAAGDDALVHLANVVRESIRPSDSLARWGGEEFVILLPETDLRSAIGVMKRVQRTLTRRYFLHNHERILITFSAGVALRRPGESQDAVIERADRALYEAKKSGRNRVCSDEDDEPRGATAAPARRATLIPEGGVPARSA